MPYAGLLLASSAITLIGKAVPVAGEPAEEARAVVMLLMLYETTAEADVLVPNVKPVTISEQTVAV